MGCSKTILWDADCMTSLLSLVTNSRFLSVWKKKIAINALRATVRDNTTFKYVPYACLLQGSHGAWRLSHLSFRKQHSHDDIRDSSWPHKLIQWSSWRRACFKPNDTRLPAHLTNELVPSRALIFIPTSLHILMVISCMNHNWKMCLFSTKRLGSHHTPSKKCNNIIVCWSLWQEHASRKSLQLGLT